MILTNSFPVLAFSWIIQSPCSFIKKMDRSVFIHHGTGIPREIRGFFNIDTIKAKEKKALVFKYKELQFKAYIECDTINRTRLMWHSDFATVINNELPMWMKYFTKFKESQDIHPEMHIIKESDTVYIIKIIDYAFGWVEGLPMTIREKNIETFNLDEFFRNKSGRKIDYIEKAKFNSKIGFLGESYILEYERNKLIKANRADLAGQVEHVSDTKGDGLGFDILSFNEDGNPKFIEVKTSITQSESFYVTKNELEFSKDYSGYFYLYRLTEFDWLNNIGNLSMSHGNLYKLLDLKPILYQGKF
ncbi:DUF3883 domain-containing protein [Clostridium sp. FP1]|uniref:DUF3883 domain-containing protein n=1 Tax=Clostridium sp. FP1 TaxID=2724076 RepID=UPI0013E97046|nr:DUF3883 domain-containing protein [Clostridium sp. FP1]MBZ9634607.1 DUF3883 domain-containing protein [Clostridium sp. FP1]